MIIEFKEIPDFVGYFISNNGIVISNKSGKGTRQTALRIYSHTTGCFGVDLAIDGRKKKFKLHRLVAKAWLKNPENKSEVNHINGDRYDNRLDNLEWVTRSENLTHKCRVLGKRGGSHPEKSKVINDNMSEILQLLSSGVKQRQIALKFNVSPSVISDIKTGKRSCFKSYTAQERSYV